MGGEGYIGARMAQYTESPVATGREAFAAGQSRRRVAHVAAVAGVVAVAAIVRAIHLADRPFWLDEAFSALYARLDLATLVELRQRGTNPPLYHILLGYWSRLFGDSETALRSLSVVAGSAAVLAVYGLGRSIAGRGVGLAAAVLLAVNSIAIGYSQEARYYAFAGLLAIVSTLLFRKVVLERGWPWSAAYAAVMIVFVWTHSFAWFVLAAHGIAAIWQYGRLRSNPAAREALAVRFGLAVLVTVASFLPWSGTLSAQVEHVLDGYWIARPSVVAPMQAGHAFIAPLAELRWPVALLAGAAAIYVFARRGVRSGSAEAAPIASCDYVLLVAWMMIPVLVPFVWSLVAAPIFQLKYALVAQPAAVILLAILLSRRPAIGLAVVAGIVAIHAPLANRGLEYEDWRAAGRIIANRSPAGTPVYICQDFTYYALAEYLNEAQHPITPVVKDGAEPAEFERLYPRRPLSYRNWLEALRKQDRAVIVLSRLQTEEGGAAFDRVLHNLEAGGDVDLVSVRGDVDVVFWSRPRRPASS